MNRAGSSRAAIALLAFAVSILGLSSGCDQTDEDCWLLSGEAVPVTTDTLSTEHATPRISSDGTMVAFTTDFWGTDGYDADGRRDIAIIDMPQPGENREPVARLFDVGNARRVVHPFLPDDTGSAITDFSGTVSASPTWHPDGVRMAAVLNVKANGLANFDRLYVFDLDLSVGAGEITSANPLLIDDVGFAADPGQQFVYTTPAFSPDGRWLAYSRFFYSTEATVQPAIYAYNLNDGRVVQVSSGSSIEWQPTWSPSGTEIAFTSNRGTSVGNTEVFKVGFDPANPAVTGQPDGAVRLTFTNVDPRPKIPVGSMQPTWMASGRIVFTSTQRPPCSSLRDRNIWTMDATGADPVVVFESRTDDQYASADPTGANTIVFTTRINQAEDFVDQKTDVWVLRDFTP